MIRVWHMLVVALLLATPTWATDAPRFSVEMPETKVIVGQPITLRLKLLVPSWMPKPPVWPTLEVPSLLVRLPERASTAISESINGETWSGISRAYRLYPLEVGTYEIPKQTLIVTYADPGKPEPITAKLTLEAIRFTAILPVGAEGLSPPVVATGLSVQQQIDGGPDLVAGDAVTRVVTISIEGTTPILLPAILPVLDMASGQDSDTGSTTPPLRAYPKDPTITETEQRGILSGSRTEITTYVAQAPGRVALPPITLSWFNLESGKVETVQLDGFDLTITAPPPPPPGPEDYARWAAMIFGPLLLVWAGIRLLGPRARQVYRQVSAQWISSELYAHRNVLRALRARDLNATMTALNTWSDFSQILDPQELAHLRQALAEIGAARFGKTSNGPDNTPGKAGWARTTQAYRDLRKLARLRRKAQSANDALSGLNPSPSRN